MQFIDKFIQNKQKVYIACSGGSDSLSLLHYTKQQGYNPVIAFFDHNDEVSQMEEKFIKEHAEKYGFELLIGKTDEIKPTCKSPKEFHRENRYKWLDSLLDAPILIGHTLDDVAEGFLFYTIRCGEGYMIPYQRNNCFRPFLLNTKKECVDFLLTKGIDWFEDPSNENKKYTRNLIRHEMMPIVAQVNPGFRKVVKRKLEAKLKRDSII